METARDRLRLAIEMHDFGVRLYRQRMRREHPEESEAQIAERVQRWLLDRPGARLGDGPGRPSHRFG